MTSTRLIVISYILLVYTITLGLAFGNIQLLNVTEAFGDYSGANNPGLAYDGVNDRYLVTWVVSGEFIANPLYQARIYASNGTIVKDTFSLDVNGASDIIDPEIVGNGEGSYLYVYKTIIADKIEAILLNSEGATVKTAFDITPSTTRTPKFPAAAYNSDTKKYMVVWLAHDTGVGVEGDIFVFGATVDPTDGSVSTQFQLSSGTVSFSTHPRIAYSSVAKIFFVVWKTERNFVEGRHTSDDGTSNIIELSFGSGANSNPNVVAHGTQNEFLVLYNGNPINAQKVSGGGGASGPEVELSASSSTTGGPFCSYSSSLGYVLAYGTTGTIKSYTLATLDSSLQVSDNITLYSGTQYSDADIVLGTDTVNTLGFMTTTDTQFQTFVVGVAITPPTPPPTIAPTTQPPTTQPPTTQPPTTQSPTETPTEAPTNASIIPTVAPTIEPTAAAATAPSGLSVGIILVIFIIILVVIGIIIAIIVVAYICRPKGDSEIVVNVNTPGTAAYHAAAPEEIPVGVPIGSALPQINGAQDIPLQGIPAN